MKHNMLLTLAAVACAVCCTACGGRMSGKDTASRSDVTTVHTDRGTEAATDRGNVGDDAKDLVSDAARDVGDAARDVGDAVGDVVDDGREIVTDIANGASEAIGDRRGDGDYDAGDNGRVGEEDDADDRSRERDRKDTKATERNKAQNSGRD